MIPVKHSTAKGAPMTTTKFVAEHRFYVTTTTGTEHAGGPAGYEIQTGVSGDQFPIYRQRGFAAVEANLSDVQRWLSRGWLRPATQHELFATTGFGPCSDDACSDEEERRAEMRSMHGWS